MQTIDELPIELECFMLTHGLFKSEYATGYKRHADVYIPEPVKEAYKSWKPSYPNEEPPF